MMEKKKQTRYSDRFKTWKFFSMFMVIIGFFISITIGYMYGNNWTVSVYFILLCFAGSIYFLIDWIKKNYICTKTEKEKMYMGVFVLYFVLFLVFIPLHATVQYNGKIEGKFEHRKVIDTHNVCQSKIRDVFIGFTQGPTVYSCGIIKELIEIDKYPVIQYEVIRNEKKIAAKEKLYETKIKLAEDYFAVSYDWIYTEPEVTYSNTIVLKEIKKGRKAVYIEYYTNVCILNIPTDLVVEDGTIQIITLGGYE